MDPEIWQWGAMALLIVAPLLQFSAAEKSLQVDDVALFVITDSDTGLNWVHEVRLVDQGYLWTNAAC